MQKSFSGSDKEKSLTFAYMVGNGVYINLTNRCTNDCEFCLRRNGAAAYGSDPLWLEREPTAIEAADAAEALFNSKTDEFVFCGYGEPMCRAETLIETAKILKNRHPETPVRINTNGQADLILNKDIIPELIGLIDTVSISLNSANAEDYVNLCRPVFGIKTYDAILDFGKRCAASLPNTVFSVVRGTLSEAEIEECAAKVRSFGAKLRVREYISENDQN